MCKVELSGHIQEQERVKLCQTNFHLDGKDKYWRITKENIYKIQPELFIFLCIGIPRGLLNSVIYIMKLYTF